MTEFIRVPEAQVPVEEVCDVLVCGGGPAGVTAAVAAARAGANVLLVERWACLGGMGTAALVNIWHTSDRQKVVIRGLVGEILERGVKTGVCRQREGFPTRHETHEHHPDAMKLLLEDVAIEAGVRLRYYTFISDVALDGDTIEAVIIESKRGRKAIRAKTVIDATGDGDVAAKAGVPFEFGRKEDGLVQGMTLMYRLAGFDVEDLKDLTPEREKAILTEMAAAADRGEFPPYGRGLVPLRAYPSGLQPNMNPAGGNPLDERELTAAHIKCRRQMRGYVEWWRKRVPGYKNVYVEQHGFSMGIRESRRITGLKTLTAEEVLGCREQPDAIGHGFWMIDIHDPKGSGHTTWQEKLGMLPAGRSYHIPFGIMVGKQIRNLLVAGRCASGTHEAHASLRLMSHCGVMGQAAGAAAALALERNCAPRDVIIAELQQRLRAADVYLQNT